MIVPAKFNQALAIAEGTPDCPLVTPEDLLDAKIVRCTPRAEGMGVKIGMTGREAAASRPVMPILTPMPSARGVQRTILASSKSSGVTNGQSGVPSAMANAWLNLAGTITS